MKVEKKGEFTPITITLETEEEAAALWYQLDVNFKRALESSDNVPPIKYDIDQLGRLAFMLFDNFNNVFSPEWEQK